MRISRRVSKPRHQLARPQTFQRWSACIGKDTDAEKGTYLVLQSLTDAKSRLLNQRMTETCHSWTVGLIISRLRSKNNKLCLSKVFAARTDNNVKLYKWLPAMFTRTRCDM